MMWSKIQDYVRTGGIVLGSVAFGALAQSTRDGTSSKLPWLHQQAATLHQTQTVLIPKLANAAGCQTARARATQDLLNKSESGADIDTSAVPSCPLAPALIAKK